MIFSLRLVETWQYCHHSGRLKLDDGGWQQNSYGVDRMNFDIWWISSVWEWQVCISRMRGVRVFWETSNMTHCDTLLDCSVFSATDVLLIIDIPWYIPIQNYTILIHIIPWFTTIKIVVKHHLVKFTCFPQKPPGFSVKSEASESRRILNPYSMVKCSDQSMVAQTPRPFRTNLVVRKPTHQRLEPQADIHTYIQTDIHT